MELNYSKGSFLNCYIQKRLLQTNYSFVRDDQASFASAAIIVEQREKFPPQLWVSLYYNRHLKKTKQNKTNEK